MSWFQKKKEPVVSKARPTAPLEYPSGLAVGTETGIYLIKGKTKFKFYSHRTFGSWSLKASQGSDIALSKYIRGGVVGFRDGSLIENIVDGKMYLISDNKKRLIVDPDVFDKYDLTQEIWQASQKEVDLHKDGDPLE